MFGAATVAPALPSYREIKGLNAVIANLQRHGLIESKNLDVLVDHALKVYNELDQQRRGMWADQLTESNSSTTLKAAGGGAREDSINTVFVGSNA